MTDSQAFNSIAQKVANDVEKLAKVIALFKEFKSWGRAPDGRFFDYEVFRAPDKRGYCRTMLLGGYSAANGRSDIPAILIALDGENGSETYVSYHYSYLSQKESLLPPGITALKSSQYLYQNGAYSGGHYDETGVDSTAEETLYEFVEAFMGDHPQFKQAVQMGAQKVIDAIEPKPIF